MSGVDQLRGMTFHGRRGAVRNAFRYRVDYLLFDPEAPLDGPWPLRRNAPGIMSLHDADHGGAPGYGRGAKWMRDVISSSRLGELPDLRLRLLAQPRVLGHVFNPVAFWLVEDTAGLRAVVAEVTNTYGDRHSYLCHSDDLAPIGPADRLEARKVLHVSPFQEVAGRYVFGFDIRPERLAIRIDYRRAGGGLIATLAGPVRPATTRSLLSVLLRRPLGSRRVLGLIHWQALRLWWKGVTFRPRPAPPARPVSH